MEARPRAPKKAMTAFMLFCNERRPAIKEESPEVASLDIGILIEILFYVFSPFATSLAKLLGEEWRNLNMVSKLKYNERAEIDKARYQREWARFSAEHPELAERQ